MNTYIYIFYPQFLKINMGDVFKLGNIHVPLKGITVPQFQVTIAVQKWRPSVNRYSNFPTETVNLNFLNMKVFNL